MRATITKKQRNEFFALCKKHGIGSEERKNLIYQYSGQATSSVAEGTPMTEQQMWSLLQWLRTLQGGAKQPPKEDPTQLKERRSQVLKQASEIFPELKQNKYERFNEFMLSRAVIKKEFRKCKLNELEQLKRQFINMQSNNEKSEANKAVGGMLQQLGMYSEPKNKENDGTKSN